MTKAIKNTIIIGILATLSVFTVLADYQKDLIPIDDPPATQSGVFAVDAVNRLYFGHSSGSKSAHDVERGRGASSEIWTYHPVGDVFNLFYQSPATTAGDLGMNSVSGICIDESSMPRTYYIADQEPVLGSPWTTGAVWIAKDVNDDGDIMDAGIDTVELYSLDTSILVYISDIIRDELTGEIYVTNAEGTLGNPMVYRLFDTDSSNYIETSEIYPYYNLETASAFAGGLTFGETTSEIYTHNTTGNIYKLVDINGDGDVIGDAGEALLFASLPIAGAYDLDMDPDGDLFVTCSDWGTMTHAVYEVTTDSTPVVTLFEDYSAIAGSMGNIAFSAGEDFGPWSSMFGASMYLNYSTPSYSDPVHLVKYHGHDSSVETPSTSLFGIIILTFVIGIIISKNR